MENEMSIDELAYYRKQQAKRPAAPIVCRTKVNIPKFTTPKAASTPTIEEFNLERMIKSRVSLFGAITTLQEMPHSYRSSTDLVSPMISMQAIKEITCKCTGVSMIDLHGVRRPRRVTKARQCFSFIATKYTLKSYPDIGRSLKQDHSTIMHGARKVQALVQANDSVTVEMIKSIEAEIERWGRK
jgi:chromosomal replication initiation ATPase DnaA